MPSVTSVNSIRAVRSDLQGNLFSTGSVCIQWLMLICPLNTSTLCILNKAIAVEPLPVTQWDSQGQRRTYLPFLKMPSLPKRTLKWDEEWVTDSILCLEGKRQTPAVCLGLWLCLWTVLGSVTQSMGFQPRRSTLNGTHRLKPPMFPSESLSWSDFRVRVGSLHIHQHISVLGIHELPGTHAALKICVYYPHVLCICTIYIICIYYTYVLYVYIMCVYTYTYMYIKKSTLQIVQRSKRFHVFFQILLGILLVGCVQVKFWFGGGVLSHIFLWRGECAREEMGEFKFCLKEGQKEHNYICGDTAGIAACFGKAAVVLSSLFYPKCFLFFFKTKGNLPRK